jgi:hypothetical protein
MNQPVAREAVEAGHETTSALEDVEKRLAL